MYKMELNQTDQDCFYNFLEEYPELADDIYMFNTHSGQLAVGLESFELSQFVVFLLSRGYDEEYETLAYNILESLSIEKLV